MAAIFIYSLYQVDDYPILAWLDSKRSYVRPYVLITSQWQRWNLFSPDPLRRVIELDIEILRNENWQKVRTINEHTVSWWQRAPELKTIRRMEDDNMKPLQVQYLKDFCRTSGLKEGTEIRIKKRWHVIPKHEDTESEEWWNTWKPDWRTVELSHTTCPKL